LLQVKIKDDLFVFPTLQTSKNFYVTTAFVDSAKTTLYLSHSRLGHSVYSTNQQLLKECNIPCSKRK